jgi:hypothetical protein
MGEGLKRRRAVVRSGQVEQRQRPLGPVVAGGEGPDFGAALGRDQRGDVALQHLRDGDAEHAGGVSGGLNDLERVPIKHQQDSRLLDRPKPKGVGPGWRRAGRHRIDAHVIPIGTRISVMCGETPSAASPPHPHQSFYGKMPVSNKLLHGAMTES